MNIVAKPLKAWIYTITALVFGVAMVWTGAAGCGDDSSENNENNNGFECTEERDGWEQCVDDRIQWCHLVTGMEPHFHWSTDCSELGLSCVETDDHKAHCVDMTQNCDEGDAFCDHNTAHYCVDGHLAEKPCGTSNVCREEGGTAFCEPMSGDECGGHGYLDHGECVCDRFYEQDPEDALVCIEANPFPEQACIMHSEDERHTEEAASSFEEALTQDHHAHLDEIIQATLDAGSAGYLRFPVAESGDYVIFLDTEGELSRVLDENGDEISASGGTPNDMCPEVWVEHYHVHTHVHEMVPYVIEFVEGESRTVEFLIRFKEDDH